MALWRRMQEEFMKTRATSNVVAHDTVYDGAIRMLGSDAKNAFDLNQEPDKIREAYGRGTFGQGCLMARRLIERGVPVVEAMMALVLADAKLMHRAQVG